jgi:hypothetical protein
LWLSDPDHHFEILQNRTLQNSWAPRLLFSIRVRESIRARARARARDRDRDVYTQRSKFTVPVPSLPVPWSSAKILRDCTADTHSYIYTWAKYFCQLVFLQIGSKPNLYVQYSKIEIYLEIQQGRAYKSPDLKMYTVPASPSAVTVVAASTAASAAVPSAAA